MQRTFRIDVVEKNIHLSEFLKICHKCKLVERKKIT